ncbi:hypothetical protein Cpir12675_000312 [Ceratocystis pirilliformis]|uniref:Rhodopsin domain-containing protein n=1 Tax=Ceratocystis pirilliformis TaxID=259994 RepID=A0ABR3ZN86_9PEZI
MSLADSAAGIAPVASTLFVRAADKDRAEAVATVIPCIALCMTITCLVAALRFFSVRQPLRNWGWEHGLLLVSLVFAFVAMGASISMKVNGLGYHANVYQKKLTVYTKMLWLDGLAHILSPRVLCKLILGFLVLTHLWIVVSIFTTCVPLSSLWDVSPFGVKAGVYCHPKAVFWLNYGLHVGTDFLIFALPIPLMFYVAVPLVQHIALFVMPIAGFAICAISAVRTATLVSNIHLDDITYTTVSYVNLTMIEIGLTISWASLLAVRYIYDPLSETQDQSPAIDAAFMREQLDIFPHNLRISTQNVPGEHKIPLDLQPLPPALHRSLQSQETMVWGEDITEYTRRHHHRLHLDSVPSPYYHQSLYGMRLTESQVAITQVQSRPQSSQSRAHSRAHSREDSQPQSRRNSDMSGFLPIFAPADTADDDGMPGRGSQDKDGRRLSYKILNIQRSTTPSSISLRFATAPKPKPTSKWRRSHVPVDDDEGNEEWGPHPGDRRSLTSPMFVPHLQ